MYVKIFQDILDSSIWDEDLATRIVWITMLIMADERGVVRASTSGIRRRAGVTRDQMAQAMKVLIGPDLDSKDQTYGGRRVERIDDGWLVLNYMKYREIRTRRQLQDAERQRRHYHDKKRETSRSSRDLTTNASASASSNPKEILQEKQKQAEREKRETSRRRELREQLTAEGQEAFDGLIKASAQPEALVGECTMILAGERQIKPKPTPEGLSLALCDLRTNNTRPTARSVRTYTADAMRQLTEGIITSRERSDATAWDKVMAEAKEREETNAH